MITLGTAKPRLLIVALDNLGDLVFSSALVPPLLARWPDASIDVWSKAYTSDVASLLPGVESVIAADPFWTRAPGQPRPAIAPFLRSIADIRRRRYDAALVTGAPWRATAAVAATGIRIRIGLERHHNRRFLTHALPPENRRRPVLLEQARLLEPLGIPSEDPRYCLDPSRLGPLRDAIQARLPERFVALHPFAGSAERCVPLEEWTQVAFALAGAGTRVLWVGTAAELSHLRAGFTHPSGYYSDQLGDASLGATAAALSLASSFAGHDSGPLHVAGAFGVPVVGVFAPGEPLRTFPQGIGPSRLIAASGPGDVDASRILREMRALHVAFAS